MRKLVTALSIVPMLLRAQSSLAQQPGNYLDHAEIQRVAAMVTVVANDPRPLHQALDAVREEYGWSIDYEDPPYQSGLELIDVTDPTWKAAHPTGFRAMNIRGGSFRTNYTESAATATSAKEQALVIRKIVADYNASGNPGQFIVRERADGRLEVVGTSVKHESGAPLRVAPILDMPITVPAGSMNLADALTAILSALNAKSSAKVGGTGPTNLMIQTQVKLSGIETSARDALHEVLSQAKIRLHWALLYDAGMQAYFLNVQMADRVEYDTFGHRHLELIR